MLIDEVDASSNYFSFLKFLAMLRTKYLDRYSDDNKTFHSIVLAGVHDIKSLKYKLRNSEEAKYNSPWNIATDFTVDMTFNPKEIAPMLKQYCKEEGVAMNMTSISEQLHYHTSGYPFLVSKLCKTIAESLIPNRDEKYWISEDVEEAVRRLLKENNPNFDSIINKLENNKGLYDLVFKIVVGGASISFNKYNPVIYQGILYGIFKKNGKISIHNRIYEQLIYDYMTSKVEVQLNTNSYNFEPQFVLPNHKLDINKILIKFQQFVKEQYSSKDRDFLEREWRLIFLAFIKPIINGGGYDFKEPQISQEKRLDIVITYYQHRYIIELKKWYGKIYHEKGLNQLADYLELQGIQNGYLVIFDPDNYRDREKKKWESKSITHQGKSIFAIWI